MKTIIQKPIFRRAYKKLKPHEKEAVDEAIQCIVQDPKIGEAKKGDLIGIFVYKFKNSRQEKLLAYTYHETTIVLIMLGAHENFYRDLKKNINAHYA